MLLSIKSIFFLLLPVYKQPWGGGRQRRGKRGREGEQQKEERRAIMIINHLVVTEGQRLHYEFSNNALGSRIITNIAACIINSSHGRMRGKEMMREIL